MSFTEWFEHLFNMDKDHCVIVRVKKGDSLWNIAKDLTGDGARWQELADANPDKKWDKDFVIHPGDELKVPESWT